jgi:hypothetical protein
MGCLQGDLHLITLVPEWPQHNTHHTHPFRHERSNMGSSDELKLVSIGTSITIISVVY